jgi:hypothetical protein
MTLGTNKVPLIGRLGAEVLRVEPAKQGFTTDRANANARASGQLTNQEPRAAFDVLFVEINE